jgi:hypothetical protein
MIFASVSIALPLHCGQVVGRETRSSSRGLIVVTREASPQCTAPHRREPSKNRQ